MAPPWLTDISRSFKRHRMGRPGWFLELHRDKLRVSSTELPRRPGEAPSDRPVKRSFTLASEPGPRTASAALVEACELFDAVLAGTWRWPTADDLPASGDPGRLSGEVIRSLIERLRSKAVGEKMSERTWAHNWQSGMEALAALADQQFWPHDEDLLRARSPGDQLASQLRRMQFEGLTPYGLRHAFALRLGIELGLSVRESAQLMGHTPQVHLNAYGRRIDQPALQRKVLGLTRQRASAAT